MTIFARRYRRECAAALRDNKQKDKTVSEKTDTPNAPSTDEVRRVMDELQKFYPVKAEDQSRFRHYIHLALLNESADALIAQAKKEHSFNKKNGLPMYVYPTLDNWAYYEYLKSRPKPRFTKPEFRKIRLTAEQAKRYINSVDCIFIYLINQWKRFGRELFIDAVSFNMWCECPSKSCHGVDSDTNLNFGFNTAHIVHERCTGRGLLHCERCQATFDIFNLFAIDHLMSRSDALKEIQHIMLHNYNFVDNEKDRAIKSYEAEIVTNVHFENVDDIRDVGARDSRLVEDCYDQRLLISLRDYHNVTVASDVDEEEAQAPQ